MELNRRVPGRAYQAVRDPQRLLIEERAEALSAAGYPLPDDDLAMYAEQILQEAKVAARSSQVGSFNENTPLSAREICQVLREVTWGRCVMTKVGQESWDGIYAGHLTVDVGGWLISTYNNCAELDYCDKCVSPHGRRWSFDSGDRYGTDPVALLSEWEHRTLEQLLRTL